MLDRISQNIVTFDEWSEVCKRTKLWWVRSEENISKSGKQSNHNGVYSRSWRGSVGGQRVFLRCSSDFVSKLCSRYNSWCTREKIWRSLSARRWSNRNYAVSASINRGFNQQRSHLLFLVSACGSIISIEHKGGTIQLLKKTSNLEYRRRRRKIYEIEIDPSSLQPEEDVNN